ncbi:hypothetical protein CRP01_39170 [Flavilitoribacter nigricans DSM 23189 = NBRC 102662]|uniref:Uncharacterized protein n=1 Tax=Flavilitoribacter nigricans (strain ATCC 23147 / DSM 23189 / NBRC 102662 / NCIMB 1420 / SS-2) TaxID=1122177 RepID=A0A2D0MY19_FLAN2|nr:hypothetical protein CRP01_39170 [Flavilitoribacter nigricans DSM 23189 = NBRC 102662]
MHYSVFMLGRPAFSLFVAVLREILVKPDFTLIFLSLTNLAAFCVRDCKPDCFQSGPQNGNPLVQDDRKSKGITV